MREVLRKSFDSHPDFPFSFNYKETKLLQHELPDHLHDWYELVYVHSGRGRFFIDRTIYEMKQGDLFVIPGNTVHRALPDRQDPVTSTALFFHPSLLEQSPLGEAFTYLDCFEQCGISRNFKVVCTPYLQQSMDSGIQSIHEEVQLRQSGYRHAMALSLQRMLITIYRESERKKSPAQEANGPRWMQDILLYIDEHFEEEIGLSKLCTLASVSPAHFSRVFKQLTGLNVTAFILTKRIIQAKKLLIHTDDNVANVAAACGFESMPYFHRVFRQMVGVTPSVYRRAFR